MKQHLRFFTTVITALALSAFLLLIWKRLYRPESRTLEGTQIDYDALSHLRYLRDATEIGAANKMQGLYPEGYLFFNVLYGLAWCDFAETLNRKSMLYEEAHVEIQRAAHNVLGDGKLIFDHTLPLRYGAFYNGWSTYLLGKKLSLEPEETRDQTEVKTFHDQCQLISKALQIRIYPQSYYGSAWPADVVLCVAALSLYDKIFPSTYHTQIENWVSKIRQHLDTRGLIPHSVHPETGKPIESARGSSMSLMLCFLPEIDKAFADELYERFKLHFVDISVGLLGVREFPKGIEGEADIDSGPILCGYGGAATIVSMRALKFYQDKEAFVVTRNVEAFAFGLKQNGRKKYLLGNLPIADVFIAWAHGPYAVSETFDDTTSRIDLFTIGSVLLCLIFITTLYKMWRTELNNLWKKYRRTQTR